MEIEVILVLGTGSGMLSDGVAREMRVDWRIGATVVVIESCLTRQAVSRPRHGQQWALSGRSGSGSSNKGDGVVTELWWWWRMRARWESADGAVGGGWWTRRGIATGWVVDGDGYG